MRVLNIVDAASGMHTAGKIPNKTPQTLWKKPSRMAGFVGLVRHSHSEWITIVHRFAENLLIESRHEES